MKEQVRPVFKCDHCSKFYLRKHACVTHEKYCGKNPENWHACFDCKFLEVDRNNSDEGYAEKTFRCTKLEKDLHTFKAEKINHSCLGYTERMPLQCPNKAIDNLFFF
jgi:hypothetical protein